MAFDFGNFISGLNQKARRAMPIATRRAYAPALNPGTIFSSAKPPVTVPGAILGLTGKVTERIMLPVAIYEQGRQVFNPQDNILTRIGDLGSGIRNLASGKPYLEGRTSSVQRPQMPGLPADYKQTELAAGAAAERFRPGAGFPGQQAAADRAYESEKARVFQLTAQDPELQRYENARKAAKTQEEMNAARDIGMQIWQEKYGKTPMAQPGGAVGVTNPLMQRTFGYQTGSAPGQQIGEPTLGPTPLVPQVDQSLNPASPNYIGGEGGPLMDFTRDEVTPELIAAYQKQLLEQAAAGRK